MTNIETQASPSAQTKSTEPHQMRITDHGKIKSFVSFSLKFLQENPQRPLVLHTFPPDKTNNDPKPGKDPQPISETASNPNNERDSLTAVPPQKKRKLAAAAATIPRLITVVEIVKREYAKLAAARKVDGLSVEDSLRTGLHQYNELGCLEDLGLVDPQEQVIGEAAQLQLALDGKNFLQQKFTPHLKVTLSVGALPQLEEKGATYQPPTPPEKMSKSAKARQRKRRKKNEAEGMSLD